MQTFLNVLLVILVIAVIALAVLYFLGRKLEKRQVEQQQLLEMSKQTVSILSDIEIKTLLEHWGKRICV